MPSINLQVTIFSVPAEIRFPVCKFRTTEEIQPHTFGRQQESQEPQKLKRYSQNIQLFERCEKTWNTLQWKFHIGSCFHSMKMNRKKNYIKNERCAVAPFQVSKISEFEPWRSRRTQCRFGLRQCLRWPSAELGIFPRPCLDMKFYVASLESLSFNQNLRRGRKVFPTLPKKYAPPDFRKHKNAKKNGKSTWTSMHRAAFPRLPIALLSALHRVGTALRSQPPWRKRSRNDPMVRDEGTNHHV